MAYQQSYQPLPQKRSPTTWWIIGGCGAILVLAALCACGFFVLGGAALLSVEPSVPAISPATPVPPATIEAPAVAEGATVQPSPVPLPATTSLPTDTPEPQPLYLGDVVEQYGYLLSAIAVEDPATPGMFYEAETGKKLVAVEIIVGNVSGDLITANPLNATLLDSEGFTYQPELGGRDGQMATVDLNPGEKVRGWVAFKTPEEATAASIKYAIETFGSKVLQASLTQPPEGYVPNIEALSIVPTEPLPKLGDVVEQYGYSLSAMTVEDPATPGMFYEPKQGYRLVAIEIIVGNVSGETLSVNPLNAALVDSDGFVYQLELGARDDQIATVDLNAGEKVEGWVAFSIPEDATPASIKYTVEVFSSKFLQTGLTN